MASRDMIQRPIKGKKPASTKKPEAEASCEGTADQTYNFQFVEVGEPSQGGHDDSRSTIRSHVMRDYYGKKEKRRRPSIVPGPSSTASQKEGVLNQTHRFKVGPYGLQEVKAGRKKSKGVSRATKKASYVATNIPEPEDIQAKTHSSPRVLNFNPPKLATFTLSDHGHQQVEGLTSEDEHWPTIEFDLLVGNAQWLPQSETEGRNVTPPETISLISRAIDSFKWLPVICTSRTQLLLYHASQAILSSRVMGPLRTEWLSLATHDQAFFYVALSHYAGNYGLARAEKDPMEAVRFRMEAMKIINERVEIVETAITDGTLGTVASLASYEATNGNLSNIRTHMKGLERMVILRGGLEEPSINPYTKRLVLWADLNFAIGMGTNSVFPSLEHNQSKPLSPSHAANGEQATTSSARPSKSYTERTSNVETLNRELKENFNNLKLLAKINADNKDFSSLNKEERTRDSDTLYLTERSLLTLSNVWGPRKFVTSGCLAAIIFIDNQLRGINFRAPLMDRVVSRLQLSLSMVLDDLSQHDLKDSSVKAILWALFVGAIAADCRPSREWFIKRLLDFCDGLDMQTWEDTENILQGFLWPAPWQAQGRILWNEVEENRMKKYTTIPDATPDNNMEPEQDAME